MNGEEIVEGIPLADLCAKFGVKSVDLMKLDVEGLESRLMSASEPFWASCHVRNVIAELRLKRGNVHHDILDSMRRHGFMARRLQGLYAWPWGKAWDLANWEFIRS